MMYHFLRIHIPCSATRMQGCVVCATLWCGAEISRASRRVARLELRRKSLTGDEVSRRLNLQQYAMADVNLQQGALTLEQFFFAKTEKIQRMIRDTLLFYQQ